MSTNKANKANKINKIIEKLEKTCKKHNSKTETLEINSTLQDIKNSEEEIYTLFGDFLTKYVNGKLNFLNLSSSELAILNATPLGITIPLEEDQLFKIKKLTKDKVYIMYHQSSDIMIKKGSSDIEFENGFTKAHTWSEFPNITFNPERIRVRDAVLNLSNDTAISFRIQDLNSKLDTLKPLISKIEEQIESFFNESSTEFDCEDLDALKVNTKKIV